MPHRSVLFVPGSRPDRFVKAADAGADAVCIDLEDAVAPAGKAAARIFVLEFLAEARVRWGVELGVRVNSPRTPWGLADLAALAAIEAAEGRPDFVMMPKVAHAEEVVIVAEALTRAGRAPTPIWPVIETAQGLEEAYAIARAPNVAGLVHGGGDLSADLGVDLGCWEALLMARARIVAACSAAGVAALDVPHIDVTDATGLVETSRRARALGFHGRLCIHPAQVAGVNGAFAISPAEADRARAVVAALEAAQGGAALLDGKLIEEPIARAARRTLKAAARQEDRT